MAKSCFLNLLLHTWSPWDYVIQARRKANFALKTPIKQMRYLKRSPHHPQMVSCRSSKSDQIDTLKCLDFKEEKTK